MLTFTEAQVLGWITPLLWPFLRILALFGTLPPFAQRGVPARIRVALAGMIAFAAQPSLPTIAPVALDTPDALLTVAQQVVVGALIGFSVRIVFAAVEFGGELVGLQMGLNLSGFFSPTSGGDATATSRFYGIVIAWLFIVTGGHLMVIGSVIDSFRAFPVGPEPLAFLRALRPEQWGAEVFRLGLWIALPIAAMLLFVNIVLGVTARVAPQMGIFSIGLPITIALGLIGIAVTLPMLQAPFTMALERMLAGLR